MTTDAERSAAWRDRKRAAGYVFRNGRAVYQPGGPRWRPARHPSESSYKGGCRCADCRAANAKAASDRKARRIARLNHG